MAPSERPVIHNRLTHSLEVAQIGRRLAEKLVADCEMDPEDAANTLLSPDVVEAACLAHDLGHPPFGHIAEKELDDLAYHHQVPEGFNGNAQSFRIVTKLETRRESFHGLNLTAATLDSILKYPWFKAAGGETTSKWGAYQTERDDFRFARNLPNVSEGRRSIEAELMDWADDVAFAVHDLDDFFRAGVIPLDRLRGEYTEEGPATGGEIDRFLTETFRRLEGKHNFTNDELRRAFFDVLYMFTMTEPYEGTYRQRAMLASFASSLIGRYVHAVSLELEPGGSASVKKDPEKEAQVIMLKQLTWHYVIDNPRLATVQFGQRKVIRELFDVLRVAALDTDSWYVFPPAYKERLELMSSNGKESNYRGLHEVWDHEHEGQTRLVIDMIASMTEQQATELHRRLMGHSSGSALEDIMR